MFFSLLPPNHSPKRRDKKIPQKSLRLLFGTWATIGLLTSCKPAPKDGGTTAPEQAPVPTRPSLSVLRQEPDWTKLDAFQKSMTKDEFIAAYTSIYHDGQLPTSSIDWSDTSARFETVAGSGNWIEVAFREEKDKAPSEGRYWRRADELPPLKGRPVLSDLRIAIDAGHIGGRWAQMEERSMQAPGYPPVREGDLTLAVARRLVPVLRSLGANVYLVRDKTEPVTKWLPQNLQNLARWELLKEEITAPVESYENIVGAARLFTVQWRAEKHFYRSAEIIARGELVNDTLKPDLVLCLHFNAADGGKANSPIFSDENHFHTLVNGCYSSGELALDDIRHGMALRLFQRVHEEEIPLSTAVAQSMATATRLPPYHYTKSTARKVNDNPYVWARNLLANRIYLAPVIFLEPWIMNHEGFVQRLQHGDYEGKKTINGQEVASLFHEYTTGITDGLVRYYQTNRKP
jgi:N-acetylmuramoyl-L-alanine amidase